jgi:hypothetical protein
MDETKADKLTDEEMKTINSWFDTQGGGRMPTYAEYEAFTNKVKKDHDGYPTNWYEVMIASGKTAILSAWFGR